MNKNPSLLEIRLFGSPQIHFNDASLEGLRRKNRALIYYIAAQGGGATREKLLTFFWPDHERYASQPILRTMIHDLRKRLGDAFQADEQDVALSTDTFIDTRDFSTVLDSPSSDLRKLTTALDLYKGDFLEGFSLPDSPQFDDWLASERERYRLMAMHGFAGLSRLHEGRHDYPGALESMRRALAFNPFQEDYQREVMRLLYLNGDRAGVIKYYEFLRKLLDEELGILPMPETRALYDSIINGTYILPSTETISQALPTGKPAVKPLLPFLGRDSELETVKGHLGSGKLILLEGEAGIGKTRLLNELIASQTQGQASALVLRGISYELEQGLPYQPIVDALRKLLARPDWKSLFMGSNLEPLWLTELSRLLPELSTRLPHIPAPVPPADEPRLWEALLRLFRGLSHLGEVWLFLDDLHWADAATIAWLGYLVRHGSSPSLHLVVTSRPLDEQTDLIKLLQALMREDRLVQIQLSALPESAMRKMAVVLSQEHNEQLSGWLIKNAEGNPFFITELVRYAQGIGLLKKGGALDMELLVQSPAIPATIQNLIQSRLLKLSENARHVLHVSAIIGREFNFELVRQVSALSETDALDVIEELQAAHLITPLPEDKFTFDHSLTMEVSLSDMNETRRRLIHRQVAEALESIYQNDLDPVSGLIAHHFLGGNLPDRAKAYAFRAGRFAANLAAWGEAIAFFKQALSLEADDMERARIFVAMGAAHFHKGDFALATKDYQSAIELAQVSRDLSLLEEAYLGLGLSLYPQARFAEAIEMAAKLRASGPPELAICAEFIWGASLIVESAYPGEAEHHLREAERLLLEALGTFDTRVTLVQIKYSLAGAFGQQGQTRKAVEQFLEVLDTVERGEERLDTLRNIMAYNSLAYYLHLLRDASAMDYVKKGIALAKERGSLSHLPYLYSTSGEIALAGGDLDAAEKYFKDGLALAEQIPFPERIAGLTANLGLVARERGDIDLAREHLEAALKLVEPLGNGHLEVRIRIWLAPLLPSSEARACLSSARILAQQGGLSGLLDEIGELEKELS
ncbi:MAG: transcriptional regulator [Anaerolineales bacterium]|nr:MAG: transcriptional regulator [Anaerolineales bacterium]